MEDHKDPHSDDSSITNGHDVSKGSVVDSATTLANPTDILIITNVPDEVFVTESIRVIVIHTLLLSFFK